ncbi:HEPN domain-containing protein [Lysinibacillus xylanilyticus]|uniref:ApeA N-terminal domain 1-containing protein n=1 Tax=Lysinibacillus xylanilyticus TaxID=582475 RepID=UPI00380E1E11
MRAKNKTIFDDFELNGIWWLPNEETKYKGTLIYSNDGISLKIIEERNPFNGNKLPIILGNTDKGLVTLIDGFVSSANKTLYTSEGSINISTIKLVFKKFILGERYDTLEKVKFDYLKVKFTGLEWWYLADPFIYDHEKGGIVLDMDTFTEFNVRVDSLDAFIGSSYTIVESSKMFFNKKLNFIPYIRIKPDEPQSLEWYEKVIWNLKNLLVLLIKSPVQIESFTANIADFRSINIYPRRLEDKKDLNLNWVELEPLSLPSLKADIDKIFNNWFDSRAKSTQLLYSNTIISEHKMMVEDIFINFTKALESYHRDCTEQGTFIDKDSYNSVVEKMIEAVEGDITNDLKSKLKATLKYANEFGFQRRIKELVKDLPEKLNVEIDVLRDRQKFADKVRNTRDQLTHYSDTITNIFNFSEMVYVNKLLRILTMVYLLRDLGIKDEVILEAIFNDYSNFGVIKKINEVLVIN